jgi:hypothetical protein
MSEIPVWDLDKSEFEPTPMQETIFANLDKILKKYGEIKDNKWLIKAKYRNHPLEIKVVKNNNYSYGDGYKIYTSDKCLSLGVYKKGNKSELISYKTTCKIPHSKNDDPICMKGNFLSYLRNAVYCALGATNVNIIDMSSVYCSKNNKSLDLKILRVFEGKGSWYRKHGYREYDADGKEATQLANTLIKAISMVSIDEMCQYFESRQKQIAIIIENAFNLAVRGNIMFLQGNTEIGSVDINNLITDSISNLDKTIWTLNDIFKDTSMLGNTTLDYSKVANFLVAMYYSPTAGCDDYMNTYTELMNNILSKTIVVRYGNDTTETYLPHKFYINLNILSDLMENMRTTNICEFVQCKI